MGDYPPSCTRTPLASTFLGRSKQALMATVGAYFVLFGVSLRNQIYSYITRNSNSFYNFSCRTNIRKFAIRFQGFKLFNRLESDIKNIESISLFKTKLKAVLLSQMFLLNVTFIVTLLCTCVRVFVCALI